MAAVTGTAGMAVALGACFGPMTPGSSTITASCTTYDANQNAIGTFDAELEVGLSAPQWTSDGVEIPFKDASLSGVGTPDDATVLNFVIDGASPTNLSFARTATDNRFDDVQRRVVTAPIGGTVTVSFAKVLVIHDRAEELTYDLCVPAAGEDATVITIPVRALPSTTTTAPE